MPPSPQSQSDEDLMAEVKAGDIDAYEVLVDRHKASIYRFAYGMLRSREDAEEAAQDTFVKLFRARGLFEEGRRLEPWLLRIAGNTCRDLLRRRKVDSLPRATSMSEELAEMLADPRMDGRDLLEAGRQAIRHELGQLSDKLRAPLVLRYVNGLTNRQVADALGISLSNVKVRMARAKDLLQNRLREMREDDEDEIEVEDGSGDDGPEVRNTESRAPRLRGTDPKASGRDA